ncbi:30S ribosome-binding factor RbfA [Clostridium sp. 'deep sea']|uniref:30S ribosome-binding factor RbfA n=1 Tax=Clostridium sp. 'deep sea' TaxID=2779445 RepID=UPI00189648F2|nr:30S ribosome-binding factor RbfA [Clostridium sp. 'deep sea']QOR36018.1 30S ribosome-binding factor RbfA [Clostridium sp. 'deep sea']
MSGYRINQQQARVKLVLSHLIQNEVKDPRLGFVSVTDVRLTKDLAQCKVFISVFGSNDKVEESLKALKSARGYLRKEMSKRANLRRAPELIFEHDDSLNYGSHINKLLKEVEEDVK